MKKKKKVKIVLLYDQKLIFQGSQLCPVLGLYLFQCKFKLFQHTGNFKLKIHHF